MCLASIARDLYLLIKLIALQVVSLFLHVSSRDIEDCTHHGDVELSVCRASD